MKTSLNLNDRVVRQAKERAVREGITLSRFIEDAVRTRLADSGLERQTFRLRLETVTGHKRPSVDISDRDALYEVMDQA